MNVSKVIAGVMKWGSWGSKFDTDSYEQIIKESIAIGVTTFDHADIYGDYNTEEEFGNVLRKEPSLRQQMQLITKCGIRRPCATRPQFKIKSYDTSFKHIIESVETSLENLGTDYIDALLIHRPDFIMNADEIASAIAQLKQQGKVLHFGVSNFTPSQVSLINSRVKVEINQIQASVTYLQPFTDGTLDQCQELGIIPMAWSPLGGGNIFSVTDDERILRIIAVAEILSTKYNTTPDVILLSWLIQHPAKIVPVLGTSKPDRIKTALNALEIKLEREEWYMLWRASTGKEVA
jgi:predicted oxidoreductase